MCVRALALLLTGGVCGWFAHQALSPYSHEFASTRLADSGREPPASTGETQQQFLNDTFTETSSEARAIPLQDSNSNMTQPTDSQLAQYSAQDWITWLEAARNQGDAAWEIASKRFKANLMNGLDTDHAGRTLADSSAFLEHFYFDADVMQMQAAAYLKTQQPFAAIKTLYQLKTHLTSTAEANKLTDTLHTWVQDYLQTLLQKKQWTDLLTLYNYLVIAEPNHAEYFFGQANIFVEVQDYQNAKLALAHVYDDPTLGTAATKLAARIARIQQGQVSIPLIKAGGNYTLKATLDNRFDMDMMIDTGASISALSRKTFTDIASNSAPVFVDTVKVSTANGVVLAERYRFTNITLQNLTASNVDFLVMDDLPEGHGLLGMNILNRFSFEIDQQNSALLLQYRQ